MKIQPLAIYKSRSYPTYATVRQSPGLLSRLPRRWTVNPGFAALLGLGLMARSSLVEAAVESTAETKAVPPVAPQTPAATPRVARTDESVRRTTAVVAPLLAEAQEFDGRGAFGCVVVNPPTFLAEDEAMELIRKELEAAGLSVAEDVELDGIMAPVGDRFSMNSEPADAGDDADENSSESEAWNRREKVKLAPASYVFGLADTNRSVYVTYLSYRDYNKWMGMSMGSSVSTYNFPALARKVSASLRKRGSPGWRRVRCVIRSPGAG